MDTLLVEVRGRVHAPVDAVAAVLRDGLLTHRDEPGSSTVEADDVRRVYAVQGGWWYRGEYTVAADGPGAAIVTHRVRNVARRMRWGVGVANRGFVGFDARTRRDFAALLHAVAGALGTGSELLADL
ncbi:MAG: hypothetical protein ABWY55_07340 [Microbacterium sp.]